MTGLGAGQTADLVYDDGAGSITLNVIPEPSSSLLICLGAVAVAARRRRVS